MLKARIGQVVPQPLLNRVLLEFPFLYRTNFINFESYLTESGGIEDLLTQLNSVLALEGDIIECGSARCGTSTVIARFLQSKQIHKKVYSLDSFGGGFDSSELSEEKEKGFTTASGKAFTYNCYEYVQTKLRRLGVDSVVTPIKGLFKDTLPSIGSKFCLSLIDCDLSGSVRYCAEKVWPSMVPNGVMLFDDYELQGFKGVRPTVEAFVKNFEDEIDQHGLLRRLYYVRKRNIKGYTT